MWVLMLGDSWVILLMCHDCVSGAVSALSMSCPVTHLVSISVQY